MGNAVSAAGSSSDSSSDDIEAMALKLDLYAQRIILKDDLKILDQQEEIQLVIVG